MGRRAEPVTVQAIQMGMIRSPAGAGSPGPHVTTRRNDTAGRGTRPLRRGCLGSTNPNFLRGLNGYRNRPHSANFQKAVVDKRRVLGYNDIRKFTKKIRFGPARRVGNRIKEFFMSIFVKSEIAPLKRVMLHRPGRELEHLTPGTLDRLLFDDIPYLPVAQAEHDRFAEILRENGSEVVYLEDLAAETLRANPGLREEFLREFVTFSPNVDYREELFEYLMSIPDDKELILKTMAGVSFKEMNVKPKFILPGLLNRQHDFALEPMPNLYFTRDPFESIGEGVAINRMYSVTRCQETIFARYIFKYHPEFGGKVPLYANGSEHYSLEGGDVLNISADTIAVGISQRTTPEAVETLAKKLFADESATIRTVLAVVIPSMRATMHLDTVLTQIDYDKFVVFPDMLPTLRVFELTPGAKGGLNVRDAGDSLRSVLEYHLHQDHIRMILCGGGDPVASQREQWNDGSNTLCVAPGKVVTYNRNTVTNRILRDNGINVLEIPSAELSRGRGGPRCMSMPLNRAAL